MKKTRLFLYLRNDSYPELREIESRWRRHQIWWRAFLAMPRGLAFWRFAGAHVLLAALWLVPIFALLPFDSRVWRAAALGGYILTASWLNLTLGGDIVRPLFRRFAPETRRTCPECGQQFEKTRLEQADPASDVRCSECGVDVPLSVFRSPYRIPRRFLSFPGWRRGMRT